MSHPELFFEKNVAKIFSNFTRKHQGSTLLKKWFWHRCFPVIFAKFLRTHTAKNTVISPNFLVWTFWGKAQFPHSFRRFARNCANTVPFNKISYQEIRWIYGILRSDIFSKSTSGICFFHMESNTLHSYPHKSRLHSICLKKFCYWFYIRICTSCLLTIKIILLKLKAAK